MTDWHVPVPTAEDAMRMASDYLSIAFEVADGDMDHASDLIENFLADDDPQVESFRLWAFASVGPLITAAAIKKLVPVSGGEQWIIRQMGPLAEGEDGPAELAAMQALSFQLNDDDAGARDVMTAHFEAALKATGWARAHSAMLTMSLFQLRALAYAIRSGAFGSRQAT